MKKGFSSRGFEAIVENALKRKSITKSFGMGTESFEQQIYERAFATDNAIEIQTEDTLQKDIRRAFGRSGENSASIGTHPDFAHLVGTKDQEYHHISSLFLDIKNSTRLSFLYDLEDVVWIKDSILKAASETVRGMDGYVHRFMGDALLAFFGSKNKNRDDSIIDAINCAAVLESLMVGTIIPFLESRNFDAAYLGFRIGLDFGPDEKVLWASYGFKEVNEITATSFYVDVAAKLQSMARKNTAMLGENILDTIDFPNDYVQKKVITVKGERTEVEHLNKVYSDRDGLQHRYKVRELKHDAYRDLLPYTPDLKQEFPGTKIVSAEGIDFKCYAKDGENLKEYYSVSQSLKKNVDLQFKVLISRVSYKKYNFPLSVKFTKRNYGREAQLKTQAGVFQKTEIPVTITHQDITSGFFRGQTVIENESTSYRGLHTMEAQVKDANGQVLFRDIIGVYIE